MLLHLPSSRLHEFNEVRRSLFLRVVMHLEKISHFVRDDSSRLSMSFPQMRGIFPEGTAQEIQTAPLPFCLVS